jgi:hypothetical protein
MAVSNSTDFNETAQQIIIDAMGELGIADDEEPLQAVDLNKGLRALNRMFKAWQADGVMIWTLEQGNLALVQGQEAYDFGAGGDFTTIPFDITDDMRIRRTSTDLPMIRLSRDEYMSLPSKTVQGYPTQWYYERQRAGGKLYVWPAPDATAGTLYFSYRRIIMDVDAGANDFDLPQEWHEAVVFGLAARLVGIYGLSGKPEAARVEALAVQSYATVKGFDVGEGRGSVRIYPASHHRGAPNG